MHDDHHKYNIMIVHVSDAPEGHNNLCGCDYGINVLC